MNEPPSHELVRQLTELQLCHPRDLHRARGRVRRLAYDLPSFDSVWIDSLVQLRLLTPYQAQRLEEGKADQLRIGSFVAIDELGRGPQGATYLAQRINRRDRCVVKQTRIAPDQMDSVTRQMQLVLERAVGFAHPQMVMPTEIIPSLNNELMTVSRFVPGLPLNELLIRRGRFPAAVVFDVGRQLLDGLAALHTRSLVHGDIRMSNVRLTDHGHVVLVDGGIRQVIHPEITIHDTMSLEAYDGIAPELIGTGAAAAASSELYAVGCLLWQLLAGRPPYTTADPLAKLAAHQTQRIVDVRTWAPDTPALLADTIRQMTSPDPNERPRGFEEVLQRWRRPGSLGRSRLKQFRRMFDGDVPHFSRPASSDKLSGRVWIFALLFAVSGVAAMFYDNGLRSELLEIVQSAKSYARSKPQTASNTVSLTSADLEVPAPEKAVIDRGLTPLPPASQDGVILLSHPGPYEAASVIFNGELTIRGAIGVKAEIQIDDKPLNLRARSVSLERIAIRHVNDGDRNILVTVRSQRLGIVNCEFLTPSPVEGSSKASSGGRRIGSLAWWPNDPAAQTGSVEIKNTRFQGSDAAILLAQTPKSLRISNSLKTGTGAFVTLGPKCLSAETKFVFDHVTLRESGPLLQLSGIFANKIGISPIPIETQNCVFQMADSKWGLIVVEADHLREDVAKSVEMSASETAIAPGTCVLTTFNPTEDVTHEVEEGDQFQGLAFNEIKFVGNDLTRTSDSKTSRLVGPRLATATEMPGIDPNRLGLAK